MPVHQLSRANRHTTDERGATLLFVMAIMLLGSLVIAALLGYTQVSLRASKSYRSRTEQVQAASDAVDLAVAEIRHDRTKGVEGSTVTADYDPGTATCEGEPGSGEADPIGGHVDRTVSCVGKISGRTIVQTRIRFLDRGGDEPGAEIQVLDRTVAS